MRAFLVLVTLTACGSKPEEQLKPGACVPQPPAVRRNLTADPSGNALYWLEGVRSFDFDGQLTQYMNLIRYDVRTRKTELILDHVEGPLTFVRGKLLALRPIKDGWGVAIIDRERGAQLVTPNYLNTSDMEPIDDHTIAILADGDGARAIYTLDLDRQRPHHLVDAKSLLNVSRKKLFAVNDAGMGITIDPITGKREEFSIDKRGLAGVDEYFYVEDEQVYAHGLPLGDSHSVISESLEWKLVHQVGSVLARTPMKNEASHTYLLTRGGARRLPRIDGGATIIGAAQLGDQMWASVEHNTANYVGDFGEGETETDICLLPKADHVRFETRNVPARYLEMSKRLFEVAGRAAPGSSMQILERTGAPTTLYFELPEKAGNDFDTMKLRVRELAQKVTSMFGDREIKTEVLFKDRRTAMQRWRRDRLRKRTSYGMGDALMGDPADFDVEVRDLSDTKKGDVVTCTGSLVNLTSRVLQDVSLHCISGDRTNVIWLPELQPNTPTKFSQSFKAPDATPLFEVYKGREPLELLDATTEARAKQVFDLAADIFGETGMSLARHKADDGFWATVYAPSDFASRSEDARREAAETTSKRYAAGLAKIYGLAADSAFVLRIEVELSSVAYELDSEGTFRRVD